MNTFEHRTVLSARPAYAWGNAVDPGPTQTGWITPELREWLLPRMPMGRLGEPEDAARLIAWLASPEARWVTGQVIHSEGGFVRG